jgi:hypothetical protein
LGVLDFFKKLYYKGEDKWYNFLDKLDKKLPVYKIIDPIDKIVPSFVLFLLFLLFLLILLGYLIRLSSPYEVTFTVFDATNDNVLQGVALAGAINEKAFDDKLTDSSGKATILTQGPKYNFYDLIVNALFQTKETFVAQISAKKTGYEEIKNKVIPFENKEVTLKLSKLPTEPLYQNQIRIDLLDELTYEKIVDSTRSAYIKYECKNKRLANSPILVRDEDDLSLDGSFEIKENNCHFIITEVSSPGYISMGSSHEIDPSKSEEIIYLRKSDNKGTARIFVYDKNGALERPLENINVIFNKGSLSESGFTNAAGILSKSLDVGEYKIKIDDDDYYPINFDANLVIKITKGNVSELKIELVPIPPELKRQIYFKVLDSNNSPIEGAEVEFIQLYQDSNGNLFATNKITNSSDYIQADNKMIISNYNKNKTDGNGLFIQRGSLNKNSKNILAIVKKANYTTNRFLPKIVDYNGGYETIILLDFNEANKASATINVKEKDTNRPIIGATAYLYYTLQIGDKNINYILQERYGKPTNTQGTTIYSLLDPGFYSAGADLDGDYFSQITPTKQIDVNKNVDFNVYLTFNLSNLYVRLINAKTDSQIAGSVVINYRTTEGNLLPLETISTSSTEYKKVNTGFKKNANLYLKATSQNYANSFLTINGNNEPLSIDNYITILMVSKEDLDIDNGGRGDKNTYTIDGNNLCLRLNSTLSCRTIINPNENIWSGIKSQDKNCNLQENYSIRCNDGVTYYHSSRINISFNEYFNLNDPYLNNHSTVSGVMAGQEYYVRNLVTIDGNVNYDEFLSMSRIVGPGVITNLKLSDPPRKYNDTFDCNTVLFDNIIKVKDNNYYYPNSSCTRVSPSKRILAGFTWESNPIEKGTYFFMSQVKVDSNSDGNLLTLQYRGKEIDNNGSTETLLLNENRIIGEISAEGLFFKINSSLIDKEIVLKESAPLKDSDKLLILANSPNKISIQIQNNTSQNFGAGTTLQVYSHTNTTTFNQNASQLQGELYFNSQFSEKTKLISSTINIDSYSSSNNFDLNLFMEDKKSSYLVIVLKNGTIEKKVFLYIETNGQELAIKDHCFLAGIPKQTTYLKVGPRRGTDNDLTIKSAKLTTLGNCVDGNIIESVNLTNLSGDTIENIFNKSYELYDDCLKYEIIAQSNSARYNQLNGIIRAGSCGTNNPELACVKVDLNSDIDEITIDWNKKVNLQVTNRCGVPISVKLESGLICNTIPDKNECTKEIIVPKENSVKYEITSINTTYNPTAPKPNFTDVLGYYPIYVKAKLNNQSKNSYAIAKTAKVHVYNSKECFAISKDYFDLSTENSLRVELINNCQYTLIDNYFIPRVNLKSFGYDLNLDKPTFNKITFRPSIIITGGTYSSTTTTRITRGDSGYISALIPAGVSIPDKNYSRYNNLVFDFNSTKSLPTDLLQIKFVDQNNYDVNFNINKPYGISIIYPIKITYNDNNVENYTPLRNFDINNHPICTGSGPTCKIMSLMEDLGATIAPENANSSIVGLFYLPFDQNKQVKKIDFNIYGNSNKTNLQVLIQKNIYVTETITTLTRNNGSTSYDLNLTNSGFTIPAIEGLEYHLQDIDRISAFKSSALLSTINPKVYLTSNDPRIQVWISENKLYGKFIGTDISGFNDGNISGRIEKTFAQGNSLGILDITDFVMQTAGKNISGVN